MKKEKGADAPFSMLSGLGYCRIRLVFDETANAIGITICQCNSVHTCG